MEKNKNTNLVWIDLEMTGLDPLVDKILEIAVIITDLNLNIIAQGPSLVINQAINESLLDPRVLKIHKKSGLLKSVSESKILTEDAERQVLDFLKQYCAPQSSPICGNSIYNDRFFIKFHMKDLDKFLHYRNIDVSTVKELVKYWYPNNPKTKFVKPENHRALEDINYSIEELKHYRNNFFITF